MAISQPKKCILQRKITKGFIVKTVETYKPVCQSSCSVVTCMKVAVMLYSDRILIHTYSRGKSSKYMLLDKVERQMVLNVCRNKMS